MEAEKHESSSICTMKSEVLVRDDKTTILGEIMKDLTDPNMIIFGVYGSSISNKINLVAQIKKRVERDGLFDTVVTASQIAADLYLEGIQGGLEGIQGDLGYQLGLDLYDNTTLEEKARCLSDKIKTKAKILIMLVLDDLQGGIDLGKIGIPFGNDHKGSKILLIAQTRGLLSDKIKTEKEYPVHDEAEELDFDSYECVPLFRQPYNLWELQAASNTSSNRMQWQDYKTMKPKLDEIERAVKQPNMRIVGVYGSSEGRELVAEQIRKRVERDGVCDEVVHVMANSMKKNKRLWRQSESPDVKRIQEELANKLGVQLHDKTSLVERAHRLCDTIKSKGNILIILDDLQPGIDLAQLGIPFPNHHLPYKIMLLAQTDEVFSHQRNAPQRQFCVDYSII